MQHPAGINHSHAAAHHHLHQQDSSHNRTHGPQRRLAPTNAADQHHQQLTTSPTPQSYAAQHRQAQEVKKMYYADPMNIGKGVIMRRGDDHRDVGDDDYRLRGGVQMMRQADGLTTAAPSSSAAASYRQIALAERCERAIERVEALEAANGKYHHQPTMLNDNTQSPVAVRGAISPQRVVAGGGGARGVSPRRATANNNDRYSASGGASPRASAVGGGASPSRGTTSQSHYSPTRYSSTTSHNFTIAGTSSQGARRDNECKQRQHAVRNAQLRGQMRQVQHDMEAAMGQWRRLVGPLKAAITASTAVGGGGNSPQFERLVRERGGGMGTSPPSASPPARTSTNRNIIHKAGTNHATSSSPARGGNDTNNSHSPQKGHGSTTKIPYAISPRRRIGEGDDPITAEVEALFANTNGDGGDLSSPNTTTTAAPTMAAPPIPQPLQLARHVLATIKEQKAAVEQRIVSVSDGILRMQSDAEQLEKDKEAQQELIGEAKRKIGMLRRALGMSAGAEVESSTRVLDTTDGYSTQSNGHIRSNSKMTNPHPPQPPSRTMDINSSVTVDSLGIVSGGKHDNKAVGANSISAIPSADQSVFNDDPNQNPHTTDELFLQDKLGRWYNHPTFGRELNLLRKRQSEIFTLYKLIKRRRRDLGVLEEEADSYEHRIKSKEEAIVALKEEETHLREHVIPTQEGDQQLLATQFQRFALEYDGRKTKKSGHDDGEKHPLAAAAPFAVLNNLISSPAPRVPTKSNPPPITTADVSAISAINSNDVSRFTHATTTTVRDYPAQQQQAVCPRPSTTTPITPNDDDKEALMLQAALADHLAKAEQIRHALAARQRGQ